MGTELKDIPGLAEKVAAASRLESSLREMPFLAVELEICGVPVKQFTPRHFCYLDLTGNPFLAGGDIAPEHVAEFLWVVSPRFYPRRCDDREAFLREIQAVPYEAAVKEIGDYLDQAFMDRPPTRGSKGGRPVTGFMASIVDRIAADYGWRPEEIIDRPFAEIFQYLRWIQSRANPKAKFINRLSDRAQRESVVEYLAKQKGEPKP